MSDFKVGDVVWVTVGAEIKKGMITDIYETIDVFEMYIALIGEKNINYYHLGANVVFQTFSEAKSDLLAKVQALEEAS